MVSCLIAVFLVLVFVMVSNLLCIARFHVITRALGFVASVLRPIYAKVRKVYKSLKTEVTYVPR